MRSQLIALVRVLLLFATVFPSSTMAVDGDPERQPQSESPSNPPTRPSSPPQQPDPPVWRPMRMCFWESKNKFCNSEQAPALCCTNLKNGECCGHDEDGWCGSTSSQGVLEPHLAQFYNTNQGIGLWDSCAPRASYGACCSFPGRSAGENGEELARCSMSRARGASGKGGLKVLKTAGPGFHFKRNGCKQPDFARYYDPRDRQMKRILIPEGRVHHVAGLTKGGHWALLGRYECFLQESQTTPSDLAAHFLNVGEISAAEPDSDLESLVGSDSSGDEDYSAHFEGID